MLMIFNKTSSRRLQPTFLYFLFIMWFIVIMWQILPSL